MKFISEQATLFMGMPARRSVADPLWESYVGHEKAVAYRLALENMNAGSVNPKAWPLFVWQRQAIDAMFAGGNVQQVLTIAQQKAEAYLSCIEITIQPAEPDDKNFQESINTCTQKADSEWPW